MTVMGGVFQAKHIQKIRKKKTPQGDRDLLEKQAFYAVHHSDNTKPPPDKSEGGNLINGDPYPEFSLAFNRESNAQITALPCAENREQFGKGGWHVCVRGLGVPSVTGIAP